MNPKNHCCVFDGYSECLPRKSIKSAVGLQCNKKNTGTDNGIQWIDDGNYDPGAPTITTKEVLQLYWFRNLKPMG